MTIPYLKKAVLDIFIGQRSKKTEVDEAHLRIKVYGMKSSFYCLPPSENQPSLTFRC